MMIIYFLYGLAFGGLGLAAYLQLRRGGSFPLQRHLPWLAAFGFVYGASAWVEMFLMSGLEKDLFIYLRILRIILQPTSGLLLLIFGWGVLRSGPPLPSWTYAIPGVMIVPLAYVITYAVTSFITPSPIEIPVDIWSRYLFYLPGSILAGIGFMRQWHAQKHLGYSDVAGLMLGAGVAFLFEAFVVGLVVPAAPYGPASYYNYDRVVSNAFIGEDAQTIAPFGLVTYLDYERVLEWTGLPIQFWRMVSAVAVTFFVVRGLDVFDAIRRRHLRALQDERDRARQATLNAQIAARQSAENWADALVRINRRIVELNDVDSILVYIARTARSLLGSDFFGLALLNEDETGLGLRCYADAKEASVLKQPQSVEGLLIWKVVQNGHPYLFPENEKGESLPGVILFSDASARTAAIVPLLMDNRPIGALWIARLKEELYTETDLIWLECMADQVVIAIQHGLMTNRLQSLSIVDERSRIARDMHDGLAQVLGYLNLQVQTLDTLLKRKKLEDLQHELDLMRQSIHLAHADVRENILSLRTTLADEKGLVVSIQEYLEEFGIQTGMETEFVDAVGADFSLSSLAEVQLVCILHESLTNVRKHAGASLVRVSIEREQVGREEQIVMKVIDDGGGFSSTSSKRTFGLTIMHERAQSVGGALKIISGQESGTMIECRLPCLSAEKVNKNSAVLQ